MFLPEAGDGHHVGRRGTLRWPVRESLVAYMSWQPDFIVEASGGSHFAAATGEVSIPVYVVDRLTVVAAGGLVLSAHHGALVVPLTAVHIDGNILSVDDPFPENDDEPRTRMHLVTLEPLDETSPGHTAAQWRYRTRLTAEAEVLFLRYPAGSMFADLTITLH